jgi:hypothetical protein
MAGKAACAATLELCQGSNGKAVCDAQGMLIVCNPDNTIASQEKCKSAALCQTGIATKTCPTCMAKADHQCLGKTLQVCSDDGTGYTAQEECDTEGLCNALLGMCTTAVCAPGKFSCQNNTLMQCNSAGTGFETNMKPCGQGTCDAAGGDCNECEPGQKMCSQNMAMTCDSGQTLDMTPCPSGTKCVGAGECVECLSDSDCSSMTKDCKLGVCMQNKGSVHLDGVAAQRIKPAAC